MNRQVENILQEQEAAERNDYQSAETIRRMIRNDFSNGEEILNAIEITPAALPDFFKMPSFLFLYPKIPLPVRKCEAFHAAKHTTLQIPYLHSHSFYEYIYVLRGECIQQIGMQKENVCLKAHQSCLLAPGTCHIMEKCGKQDIILKFSISEQIFEEAAAAHSFADMKNGFTLFKHGDELTDLYARRLLLENRNRDGFTKTAVKNYLSLLFIELNRAAAKQPARIVSQLEAYFEKNPGRTSLPQFAASVGYSADHAGRLIRQVTGKTFGEYRRDKHLMDAAQLLSQTDDTIESVALAAGYATVSGFYKQFCRLYGMAPGEYRKTFLDDSSFNDSKDRFGK